MKADLNKIYFKSESIFYIILGTFLIAIAVLFELEDVFEKIFIACGGVLLVLFGINKIRKTPVRNFFAEYSGNIEDIENSYMYGEKIFHRGKFCGVNIGKYIVIYKNNNISAFEIGDISQVNRRILRKKYYGNGIYNGIRDEWYLDIFTYSGKRFTVQLDEFQTEMLYERLKIRYSEPKISRETISEFST